MEEIEDKFLEEGFKLKPFTKEDLKGMKHDADFCDSCVYAENCETLEDQNKKAMFRDGIQDVSGIWGCTIHTTEEQALEDMEEEEIV